MRIAFYAPLKPPDHPVPSGDRRMARLLMDALGLAGHQVELASRLRSFEPEGDAAQQAAIASAAALEATRIRGLWAARPAASRPRAWFTYHVYHKAPDWLGPVVSAALGIPYLIAEASHAPKRAEGPWADGHRAAAEAIAAAAHVFCLTRFDMQAVAPLTRPERLSWLPPFLDPAPLRAATLERPVWRQRLAAELALPREATWLLAVGMMRHGDKLESYRRLGAALRLLPPGPWRLLVVGDGAARNEVQAALAPFGERVAWLGARAPELLAGIYAAADICLWPAAGEAYGMALLEAAAAGLPVVAGAIRGVPDIVLHGRTGLLALPDDAADFAAKVAELLASPGRRRSLGEAAAAFVAGERSLAAAAAALCGVLDRLQPEVAR